MAEEHNPNPSTAPAEIETPPHELVTAIDEGSPGMAPWIRDSERAKELGVITPNPTQPPEGREPTESEAISMLTGERAVEPHAPPASSTEPITGVGAYGPEADAGGADTGTGGTPRPTEARKKGGRHAA